MIRFLQISDIHFNPEALRGLDIEQMQSLFLQDIKHYDKQKQFDYFLICGDVAYQGKQYEYAAADQFISEIIKAIDRQIPVFAVPGNHDLNRGTYKELRTVLRKLALKNPSSFIQDCCDEKPLHLSVLFSRFKQFYKFAIKRQQISPIEHWFTLGPFTDEKGGKIKKEDFYHFAWQTEIKSEGGYKVFLVGLNSALLSGSEDDKDDKHQLLTENMLNGIITRDNEVKIFMAHHPLDFIHNNELVRKRIDSRFALQFYGHIHSQSIKTEKNIIVHSGAFGPSDQEITDGKWPVYNIVDVSIIGDKLNVEITCVEWDGERFTRVQDNPDCGSVQLRPQNSMISPSLVDKNSANTESSKGSTSGDDLSYSGLTSAFIQSGSTVQQSIIRDIYPQKGYIPTGRASISAFLKKAELNGNQEELYKLLIQYYQNGKIRK